LSDGRLDGSSPTADDVADEWYQDKQSKVKRRIRLWDNDVLPDNVDLRWIRTIDIRPFADEENDGDEGPSQTRRFWYWYEQQADGDGAELSGARKAIRLSIHARDTTERIQHFVETLDLPEEMKKALVLAAKLHDLGKRREVWQRSIGNMESDPAKWLAKSGAKRGPCRNICPNYRHEFGSLLDVVSEKHDLVAEWHGLGAAMQDLVLHLIAAHHGRARPHFSPKEAYDFENHEQDTVVIAAEVSRRFARLQRKYGRWGLAYLESLLRAADYAASAEHSVDEEE